MTHLLLSTLMLVQTIAYPPTRHGGQVDDYHGTKVSDPYRWLEDVDSPETHAWVEAENHVTFGYLEQIPERERIRRRLTELWDYPKYGAPFKKGGRGGRYFFFKNAGLQNQAVLYTQSALAAEPQVLLDPNTLSADGTVALTSFALSEDGGTLVYGTSGSGSDWQEFRVRDVATGQDKTDHLQWIKFSGAAWTHDGLGFFYSRYPQPAVGADAMLDVNRDQKVYYHRLGTDQSADRLIYERPDHSDWGFAVEVSADGRYAVYSVWLGTDRRNRVYFQDLGDPLHPTVDAPVVRLLDDFDASYDFVGNDGAVFYFATDQGAPKKRVIAVDTRHPDRAAWRELIPQGADVLEAIHIIHDTFVTLYLHDAYSQLRLFALDGRSLGAVALPTLGSIVQLTGERGDNEMFYAFTSFLYPTTIFRHDFTTGTGGVFKAPAIAFDPARYETVQVFYRSKDGTRVPMFLTYKKDLKKDGSNPTYLYAYGGFNVNMTPGFSIGVLQWLEMGGVYAQAVLRGGAEYGEEWHQAGMLERKQNVFDDFIAAAEFLIAERYTSPPKLAIGGGSNGGLLIGAVLNQRPELFGAALPAVGVMDMLRFHKFTIGWAWVTEYGSADSVAQFPYLYRYSPLHNIKPGTRYPPTLITTADHDDRVVPGHSFKYAAALQAAQSGAAPVLIRIETKAGHGAGKPTAKVIEEQTDRWAFLVHNLHMTLPPPPLP